MMRSSFVMLLLAALTPPLLAVSSQGQLPIEGPVELELGDWRLSYVYRLPVGYDPQRPAPLLIAISVAIAASS